MRTLIENAYVYSAETGTFSRGSLMFAGDRIVAPCGTPDLTLDADGAFAVPGFVDVHTHGRQGYDFCSADRDGLACLAKSYLSVGTTTLFPTLASAPYRELLLASDRINAAKSAADGAYFAGIHLEGRYLNPEKRGAHAVELLALPNAAELDELIFRMCLPCHITAALELDTDGSFAKKAKSLGATLGLGHTTASYEKAADLYEKYGISFSHLFNAMPPLSHRDAGAVCAGLTSGAYCELICDGLHISPEMIRLAYKCLGNTRFSLITDSMEASGCPDGNYTIAGTPCTVVGGKALTPDGKLAGSTLDLKTALENLMKFCLLPLETALRCATLTPAEQVGIQNEVGSLTPGKRADILLLRQDKNRLSITKTVCGGRIYDK